MVPGPSPDRPLSRADRANLLAVARRAIESRLNDTRLRVRVEDYPDPLRERRASFVTLYIAEELRGCVGSVEPRHALVEDVSRNAGAAAFEDPRFPPLARAELTVLTLRIAVLSSPEPIEFGSKEDLLSQIRPHVDGLLLEDGARRATFLPAVWTHLPDAAVFLQHLIHKAGLPDDYWSPTLRVSRYTVESVQ
jgi:AmmeMemoRadiSam system protein A